MFQAAHFRPSFPLISMIIPSTVGLKYEALRKECLQALRQWPGGETVAGIQIIRTSKLGGFLVGVTLYGSADKKIADRAMRAVQVKSVDTFI
jgi:hypothetical protein